MSMEWRSDAGLADRVVVVTGAAGGIGRSVCAALDAAGARVFAVDVDAAAVAEVLGSLAGGGHAGGAFDLRDLSSHDEIFRQAGELGELAALTHMAAVLLRRDSVDDVTEADWDLQQEVNLKGTFFLNRAAYTVFRRQGTGGSIVNFTSQGWWSGGFGGSVAYAATKGGIVSMTRGFARSFAPDGVRVNAVAPGGVNTPMMWSGMTEESMAGFVSMIPLGRLAEPDELSGAVVFLASDAASYITGAVINVSGGQLMY